MLPTQASGRWSTTDPPLTNFPPHIRNVVIPDHGTYWVHWDMDAIESRIEAMYSHAQERLTAFRKGLDVHIMTMCRMQGYPLPPLLTKAYNTDPSCAEWRALVKWTDDADRRRHLAKTCTYGMIYGFDENAILRAKDIEKLGLTREELLKAGKAYLDSRPEQQRMKLRIWGQCLERREARTVYGRRRRLFPSTQELEMWHKRKRPGEAARQGLSHTISGTVTDYINLTIIAVKQRWPMSTLAHNAHDGLTFIFPKQIDCWPELQAIAERELEIEGEKLTMTASFEKLWPDGIREELKAA